jgi:hypothetical protein
MDHRNSICNLQAALMGRTEWTSALYPTVTELIAAMRIQHAFRNYNKRKQMAAARIQNH